MNEVTGMCTSCKLAESVCVCGLVESLDCKITYAYRLDEAIRIDFDYEDCNWMLAVVPDVKIDGKQWIVVRKNGSLIANVYDDNESDIEELFLYGKHAFVMEILE